MQWTTMVVPIIERKFANLHPNNFVMKYIANDWNWDENKFEIYNAYFLLAKNVK